MDLKEHPNSTTPQGDLSRYYIIERLPLSIIIPRKTKLDKVFHINLNNYRNAHFRVLAQTKILFGERMDVLYPDGFTPIPFPPPYHFIYTIRFGNQSRYDLLNIGSILDKYLSDYLVDISLLSDDSEKVIPHTSFISRGRQYKKPHGVLYIKSFQS